MLDVGLMVGLAGIFVATLAGVLGVWMERDRENPPWFALFFSALIVFASFIEVARTGISAWNDAAAEDTMARVLEELTELSERSDNPELASFVGAELSRSNPKILKRVEKRIAARGGDPGAVKRRAAEGKGAGKAGKAGGGAGDAEGKAGKAGGGDGAEGKAGKAGGGDGAEGKAGKAGGDGAEGKAGKAGGDGGGADGGGNGGAGDAEGKAGKAGGGAGDAEGKAGKAGKAG